MQQIPSPKSQRHGMCIHTSCPSAFAMYVISNLVTPETCFLLTRVLLYYRPTRNHRALRLKRPADCSASTDLRGRQPGNRT